MGLYDPGIACFIRNLMFALFHNFGSLPEDHEFWKSIVTASFIVSLDFIIRFEYISSGPGSVSV